MSHSLFLRPRLPVYTCPSCLTRVLRGSHRSISSIPPKERRYELPSTPARTRFAPSPTGYLHIGSLRTALFNYLLAKSTGGQFLLRIEDTDQKRTIPDAESRLFRDLRWAGLQWDEGPEVGGPYGPYKQSERSQLYHDHAHKLLDNGHAYRCFCSADRLNALAQQRHKVGIATDYDRTCANIPKEESDDRASKGESHVIRLKVPDRSPAYEDLVYGLFKPLKRRGHVTESAYEDPILLKSDGLPTYHLANVVDDHHMKITHVIRGSEWMPSTPKHITLYNAFGWTPPQFGHVGLLVDKDGSKLSKRNFDTGVDGYREMEIFPETLTNFAALLGWSHTEKSDVMDLAQLVEKFTLKFTKGNTMVTFGKLHFLQRKHAIKRVDAGGKGLQEMVDNVVKILKDEDSPYKGWEKFIGTSSIEDYVQRIIVADNANYTNANEFLYRNRYLFMPLRPTASLLSEYADSDMPAAAKDLALVEDWSQIPLLSALHNMVEARGGKRVGAKEVYHYLRRALMDRDEGIRLYEIMLILGREETLARLGVSEV
ncbi:glutamyl-tRNA synthetase [Periconia macrospinosa]|uniref:Glutamate--tRNA ligase, mitochondrial n=1 Tax=Periconia macrospinosa TaxID=97972 RepID=A0A2V1E3J9_9PLEO|nr:glutamyl-tRNA synthetase [Periconia macrospinosa]